MGDHIIERAVFSQPFHRRLRPHLGDAGHVVHRVTHQRQIIDDALRRHAKFGFDARHIERLVAHGVNQRDMAVHQLRQILVTGRDHRLHAGRRGMPSQRADHVIRLDPIDHQQRPAKRAHRLMNRLDLRAQVIRHRRALRFIFRVQIVTKSLALRIKHARQILGAILCLELFEHGDHAVHGPGGFTGGAAQVRQGVKCAIQVGRTVYQQQTRHGETL